MVMWMGKTERMAKLMDECFKTKAANLQTNRCPPRVIGVTIVNSPGCFIRVGGLLRSFMDTEKNGRGMVRIVPDVFDQIGLVVTRDLLKSDVGNGRPRVQCNAIGCLLLGGPGTRYAKNVSVENVI